MVHVSQAVKNNIRFNIKKYGLDRKDAAKFLDLIDKIPTDVMFGIMTEEAKRLAQTVVREIQSQPVWWAPLNEDYKRWKISQGLSEEMLKATEEYIQSIGVQEAKRTRNYVSIYVGVPNRKHKTANMSLNKLGGMLEHGTSKMPPRPHWAPAIRRWEFTMPSVLARIMNRTKMRLSDKIKAILIPPNAAKTVKK